MSSILTTTNQARWPDSYAASARVGLTVRSNGEEAVQVYTPDRQLVQAGIDAPTVAAVVANGGGGSVPAGVYYYFYCYASSRYPNVDALVTAGGELWPKSNPSPVSLPITFGGGGGIRVTVTKTTRSDVDRILIYRTPLTSVAADAAGYADAGEAFYVGYAENDGIAGTVAYNDAAAAAQEQMELDNHASAQFQHVVFEAPYWYGFGNPPLDVEVTLSNTVAAVAAAGTFYAGRNGQQVTFDGITSGGFDGRGTFYFKYASSSVANVSLTSDLSAAATIPAIGTTTMRVRGYGATLYRSKPHNPFAWGYTEYLTSPDGKSVQRVPQQFAFNVGGRGSAIAVLPEQRLLKLDVENPAACYTLSLGLAGSPSDFFDSKRIIDRQYTVSSQNSQFVASFPGGATALCGIDAGNRCLVRADPSNQQGFGDEVVETLRAMVTTDDNPRLYHGVFDPSTELSCWWIKTATDPQNLISIDTCICYHGPSGQFSLFRDFDVTASASVYDPVTLETIILVGTASGQIAQAFVEGVNANLYQAEVPVVTLLGSASQTIFDFASIFVPGINGAYFDVADLDGPVRFYFSFIGNPPVPPATPMGGRLVAVPINGAGSTSDAVTALAAVVEDSGFTAFLGIPIIIISNAMVGPTGGSSIGTVGGLSMIGNDIGAYNVTGLSGDGALSVLLSSPDNTSEAWLMLSTEAAGVRSLVAVYDPATGEVDTLITDPALGGTSAGAVLYPGLINCEAQTYFQPSQSRASVPKELWSTFRNADADNIFFRLYEDFDTDPLGSPIVPVQTERRAGVDSMNWVAKNLPSVQTNQMGYRLVERGYEPFEVLGLDVKQHRT